LIHITAVFALFDLASVWTELECEHLFLAAHRAEVCLAYFAGREFGLSHALLLILITRNKPSGQMLLLGCVYR
jgi:hypothetical protein